MKKLEILWVRFFHNYKNWAKACGSKYLSLTSVISSVETFDNSQNKMIPLGELQKK